MNMARIMLLSKSKASKSKRSFKDFGHNAGQATACGIQAKSRAAYRIRKRTSVRGALPTMACFHSTSFEALFLQKKSLLRKQAHPLFQRQTCSLLRLNEIENWQTHRGSKLAARTFNIDLETLHFALEWAAFQPGCCWIFEIIEMVRPKTPPSLLPGRSERRNRPGQAGRHNQRT